MLEMKKYWIQMWMAGDKNSGILKNRQYLVSDKTALRNRKIIVLLLLAYTFFQIISCFNQVILCFVGGCRIIGRGGE